jgi:hypothetical protein
MQQIVGGFRTKQEIRVSPSEIAEGYDVADANLDVFVRITARETRCDAGERFQISELLTLIHRPRA